MLGSRKVGLDPLTPFPLRSYSRLSQIYKGAAQMLRNKMPCQIKDLLALVDKGGVAGGDDPLISDHHLFRDLNCLRVTSKAAFRHQAPDPGGQLAAAADGCVEEKEGLW